MKANIFNDHFVEQCSLINNESTLATFVSRCNSSLSDVEITGEKILSIIRSLNVKKAHGCDDLSINMIKICDTEIVKPLYLIYMKCLETITHKIYSEFEEWEFKRNEGCLLRHI